MGTTRARVGKKSHDSQEVRKRSNWRPVLVARSKQPTAEEVVALPHRRKYVPRRSGAMRAKVEPQQLYHQLTTQLCYFSVAPLFLVAAPNEQRQRAQRTHKHGIGLSCAQRQHRPKQGRHIQG